MSEAPTSAIVPTHLYTLNTARALMGWTSQPAWLTARRLGLKYRVKYIGRRGYLTGEDLILFVQEHGTNRCESETETN